MLAVSIQKVMSDSWSWLLDMCVGARTHVYVCVCACVLACVCVCACLCLCVVLYSVVVLLHGDMGQADRDSVITSFKRKEVSIMVATDVAGINMASSAAMDVVQEAVVC